MTLKFLKHPGVLTLTALSIITAIAHFTSSHKTKFKPADAFSKYITAYTGGEISRKSPVIVRFVDEMVKASGLDVTFNQTPITLSPDVYGQVNWLDTRTLQFTPRWSMLDADQVYEATLNLKQFIPTIPDSLSVFRFKFKTKKQGMKISISNPTPLDPEKPCWQKITGTITTADVESYYNVRQFIDAYKDGNKVDVHWENEGEGTEFQFTVDSLLRNNNASEITFKWNAYEKDPSSSGKKTIKLPALEDFMITGTSSQSYPNQNIVLEFSDPLKKDQAIEGLVRVRNSDVRLQIEENKIYVYPKERLTGEVEIIAEAGIQNIYGKKTREKTSFNKTFEEIYPEVKMVGKGTIIPQSNILPLSFEAVNLNAIDIRIMKIAEKSIPQFLQINKLEESRELKRVGAVMFSKKINLTKDKNVDLKKWNKHTIDLSKIIQTEPGAIYQIAIGYRKSYSLFGCSDTTEGDSGDMLKMSESWDDPDYESEYSYWNDYEQYGESYEDKGDPCKKSYYNSERSVVRNVLASNLGLVAKRGSEGSMFVATTDLLTTSPLSNVDIEAYDYHQQLIAWGKTQNGITTIHPKGKPFLIIAKHGKQRGYLRVDNGTSLSLSRFDVSGRDLQKGLQGFIFGERDVWRPGDSLFINFVLEDKKKTLPAGHPVIFELYNPQQELVQRIVKNSALDNFYTFHTATEESAPTGNYSAKIQAGGITFEKNIKIETIVPNRLKIKLDWGTKTIFGSSKQLKGTLSAQWLHGAQVQNLPADISVTLTQGSTAFKTYSDFTFSDPYRKFDPERKEIFKGSLNEKGQAAVNADISVEGIAAGVLQANFKTKVFEPGGNFSTDYYSIPFHPYSTYVGIKIPKGDKARNMLLTDIDHPVKVVTLNPEGKPVSGKKVIMELYKVEWKWWWDASEDENYTYNGREYSEPIQRDTLVSKDGEATWKLRVNYPNWGRYMIRACEEGGHSTGKTFYIDWPGWAGRAQLDSPEGAKMLTFSADKEVYNVGENITLNIPTGFSGRALLSLESGTKVIGSYWVEAQKGMTQFKFPATSAMAPSVYAHITLLQPHSQTLNDLPIRMYGIIPIRVEDPKTRLHPVIAMADQLKPEQNVSINIHEQNGQPMTYTLAIVDEGLLDLTRYKTPDIWSKFNERLALDVKTWDMFDDVAGADANKGKNLLSIGGDGRNGPLDGAKANRFKPVVMFMGPFHLGSGQSKSHTFKMPNYVGSVKTMVIAAHNGAYGHAEKATPVKKPLMVLGTLPRVLSPNEELMFPLTLFVTEPNIKNVSVQVDLNDMLMTTGPLTTQLTFTETGEKQIYIPLKVNKAIGIGKIKVTVKGGKEVATYETSIDIRNPNPRVENVFTATINENDTWTQEIIPVGMKGTNLTILDVSTIPPLNLGKRLEYLIQYPYGCVEQTTSSVFPQVVLNHILNLPKERKKDVDKNIRAGIARLKTFQKPDGSLSFWPGSYDTNEWGTCYAGHFMIEAEIAGYTLPYGFKDKWKEYLKTVARNWSDGDELTQAYRLYLLALAKSPELGAMNRMKINKIKTTPALWYLAAAYHLAGQTEVAKQMTVNASTKITEYKELSNTFGSDERDKAIILQTLSIMGERTKGVPLVQELSKLLSGKEYLNTQATAYALIAIAKYAGKYNLSADMQFAYKLKNGNWKEVSCSSPVWEEKFKEDQQEIVEIKNKGKGILFVNLVAQGIPEEGNATDAFTNLVLNVIYKTMDGKVLNPSSIPQGTDFMAEVSIIHPGVRGDYAQMSLTQIFPSGWEIHNTRMGNGSSNNSSNFTYQDIRDDRVNTFFDLKSKENKTFTILLNASYEGKYYLPSIFSEAMYDNTISARRGGMWVKVVKNSVIQ